MPNVKVQISPMAIRKVEAVEFACALRTVA